MKTKVIITTLENKIDLSFLKKKAFEINKEEIKKISIFFFFIIT